ncbi:lipase 3-like isoform X2 [Frankliniella occidentalis]|uniref:Lipase 3-like isoform X2 n=1 Tax=Frankliniella occidentalis TaxID=133901 RepID=A0A9C6U1M7_FRAOC|nr:lipase 3-like isoform X2 [Frankliniella occidentalis]
MPRRGRVAEAEDSLSKDILRFGVKMSRENVFACFILVYFVKCAVGLALEPIPRTPAEILKSDGYPSEVHHVTTEDGYILQIDRIPRPGQPVVYLANQLFSSAAAYLILGKGKSIGFLLYDTGFDVWLGNFRGTNFSLTHQNMTSSDDNFWKFGWHEHGTLDNPAIIDYILSTSKQSSLVFMGHSMGATTFFVTASERPDTLSKIRAAFLMGPATFLAHHRNAALSLYHPFANLTRTVADLSNHHRQPVEFIRSVIDKICNSARKFSQSLCRLAGLSPDDRIISSIIEAPSASRTNDSTSLASSGLPLVAIAQLWTASDCTTGLHLATLHYLGISNLCLKRNAAFHHLC